MVRVVFVIALLFFACPLVNAQAMEQAEINLLDFWRHNSSGELPLGKSYAELEPDLMKLANLVVIAQNNFRKIPSDSSNWHKLEDIIPVLQEKKFFVAKAYVQFQMSKMFYRNNKATDAIELILQCKEILNTKKKEEAFPHLGSFYAFLGEIYIDNGEPLHALNSFKMATKFTFCSLRDEYYCWGNIGLTYFELDKTKEALTASFKALDIIRQIGDSTEAASMLGNIGTIYLKQGDYNSALVYLEYDYAKSMASKNWKSASAVQIMRSKAFFHLEQYDNARSTLKIADSIAGFCNCSTIGARKEYYERLSKLNSKTGDLPTYVASNDSFIYYSDKLNNHIRKNISNFSGAELKVATKIHETKMLLFESEKKRQVLIRNLIIAACILVLLVVVFILSNQRLARKSEKRMYELNLSNSKKQLDAYLENIRNKNSMLNDLQQQLENNIIQQKKESSADLFRESDIELAAKLEKASLITEESWLEFTELVEQVHRHFFIKLNLAFPNLTPAEIRLATLIKLKFSLKESAVMLGISSDSIKKARYRLKKKLGEGEEESIDEIIHNI